MSLVEEFRRAAATPGNSTGPLLGKIAEGMDRIAKAIAGMPGYDTRLSPQLVPSDTGCWAKAFQGANGWGDMLSRLEALCRTMDDIEAWIAEQAEPEMTPAQARMAKARAARKSAA